MNHETRCARERAPRGSGRASGARSVTMIRKQWSVAVSVRIERQDARPCFVFTWTYSSPVQWTHEWTQPVPDATCQASRSADRLDRLLDRKPRGQAVRGPVGPVV